MSQITNYTTLVNAVVATAEDDGVEFALFIPTAVSLAEDLLMKELDLPELEQKASGTLTSGSNSLAKPSGYRYGNYLRVVINNEIRQLKKKREDYIMDFWPNASLTDVPKYYADEGQSAFIIAPTPNSNYAYTLKYTAAPTKLSTTNATNYFVINCADILYYATMVELARFMKAWSQVQFWQQQYALVRDAWNIEASRKRRDDSDTPQNPDANINSLKHTVQSAS